MLFIKSSFTLSLSVHVFSCCCTYIYMQLFCLFCWRLMKVNVVIACPRMRGVIQSGCNSLPPPTCGFITTVRNVSRPWDDQRAHRWSRSQPEADLICGGQIFSQRMALNGDRIECSTLMSIWLPPRLTKQFNVDRACLEPHQCVPSVQMPDWSSNRCSLSTCMPIFSPSLFFFFFL